jgi:hypothetical protein
MAATREIVFRRLATNQELQAMCQPVSARPGRCVEKFPPRGRGSPTIVQARDVDSRQPAPN